MVKLNGSRSVAREVFGGKDHRKSASLVVQHYRICKRACQFVEYTLHTASGLTKILYFKANNRRDALEAGARCALVDLFKLFATMISECLFRGVCGSIKFACNEDLQLASGTSPGIISRFTYDRRERGIFSSSLQPRMQSKPPNSTSGPVIVAEIYTALTAKQFWTPLGRLHSKRQCLFLEDRCSIWISPLEVVEAEESLAGNTESAST
ncbi:hypothetical protein DL98DRAFT_532375 [Cadophora sp. DSE1049]|nr:hypothetical protein DL98DRAFT_532375 [Cadophora sp. DSE1049]